MNKPRLAAVIATLEQVRQRPGAYIAPDVPAIINFLHGFYVGCAVSGITVDRRAIYDEVVLERGWKITSFGPFHSMKEKGLNDDAILDELLAIEIETWKRVAKAKFEAVLKKIPDVPPEPYDQ